MKQFKLYFFAVFCVLYFSGCFSSSPSTCDSSNAKDTVNKIVQENYGNLIIGYNVKLSDIPEIASYGKELDTLYQTKGNLENESRSFESYDNTSNKNLRKFKDDLRDKYNKENQLANEQYYRDRNDLYSKQKKEVAELSPTFLLEVMTENIKKHYENRNKYIKDDNERIEAKNKYSEKKQPFLEYLNYEYAIEDLVKNYGDAINNFKPINAKDSIDQFLNNLFNKRKPQLFIDLKSNSFSFNTYEIINLAEKKLKPKFDEETKELEAKHKEESNKLEATYKEESNELDNNYKIELDKNRAPIKEKLKTVEDKIKILENKKNESINGINQKLVKDIKIEKIVEEGLNKEETIRKCSANVTFKDLSGKIDSIKSRINYVIKKSDNGDIIEVKKLF